MLNGLLIAIIVCRIKTKKVLTTLEFLNSDDY